ncbi:MAG: CCA tRNA nucleotidyltransferase [Rhodothermia bacterium]|nr:CCA tRNA nucleotidyltransferase [Rhodothermia bacterium]
MDIDIAARISRSPLSDVLKRVGHAADELGVEVYAVGGVVRDLVLGRSTSDLDFVTVGAGSGIKLAEEVAKKFDAKPASVYPKFGTAAVRVGADKAGLGTGDDFLLEFVAARKESYRSDSRKPLVEDGTLEDDQRRRDFTINAMALSLNAERYGEHLDPFDGMGDLQRRIIRTPLDPADTFADDPLRMVRAARFAAQLDFRIDDKAFAAMRHNAERVRILSQERITDEIEKIMCCDEPSRGFIILEATGILELTFPELVELKGVEAIHGRRHKDNFFHTLQVLDNLVELTDDRPCEDTYWLRWAALLHDIGKPATKRYSPSTGWTFHSHEERGARMISRLFRRLKLPTDDRMRYVRKLIRLHHRPVALVDDHVTDSAVRRLLFDAGEDIDDLMTLVRADITSKNPRRVRRYLNAFDSVQEKMLEVEEKDRLRNFQPPVDGNEIMEVLGLPPSRVIGDLKEAVREAILDGIIPNEHDAAFDYMMEIKDDILAQAEEGKRRR